MPQTIWSITVQDISGDCGHLGSEYSNETSKNLEHITVQVFGEKSKGLLENDFKLFMLKRKITSVKSESHIRIKLLSGFGHSMDLMSNASSTK